MLHMPALNLRDFPADLLQTLKTDAEAKGATLREHCIHLLTNKPAPASQPTQKVAALVESLPVVPASQIEPPSEGHPPGSGGPHKCWRCQGPTIPWGPGRRCRTCAINF